MPADSCPVVLHPDTVCHVPGAEIWLGVRTPATETAERVDRIRDELGAAGHVAVTAQPHEDDIMLEVHSPELVGHLATVWQSWVDAGYPDLGADRVVPYMFATEEVRHGLAPRRPTALHAQVSQYCYDTMTLVGPGSWAAIRASIDVALTAVDLVVGGAPLAYALTRPPGHHATRGAYGGSCYLNNAAVAAAALLRAGHRQVAVVDIDAHHGNGTQAIYYERADVLYASVHVDPGAGWFPHHVGFADETGRAAGAGANHNVPLPPGSGDEAWLSGVQECADAVAAHGASALVVSLGVDAAADDPESPLQVTAAAYQRTGALLAQLALPTVAVQEGGYHLPTLGALVAATLDGLARRPEG